ncbi:GerMN domain-containing protein [Paenibacillus crassostreae]|uniref:GerMN domain-containing protein n=1 Tax=Paenibacillus crassostreae TaxID=1763538 RepID=A0A167DML3_9BACL|nr:GerMN domain-containing protein [Paenibacillus crassostreae]AOZ91276.1 hypothetical protein LPB68_03040 [Paenibacillus crassostreae]OAB74564.1 hypothetical protein PNBC_10920 [Paenibacillus crassostreae]
MNKKWWCTGLLVLVVAIGTACGDKPQVLPADEQTGVVQVPDENVPTTNASGGVNNNEPPKDSTVEQSQKENIKVYYTDPQAMELLESQQEITFNDDIQKYQASFKALQTSGSDELIPLWGKIELLTIDFSDGALTIDIHMPDEARLGSGGEMYAIESLQNTFFQFEEVKSIELLVDGAQIESLMGHVELEHPMMKK